MKESNSVLIWCGSRTASSRSIGAPRLQRLDQVVTARLASRCSCQRPSAALNSAVLPPSRRPAAPVRGQRTRSTCWPYSPASREQGAVRRPRWRRELAPGARRGRAGLRPGIFGPTPRRSVPSSMRLDVRLGPGRPVTAIHSTIGRAALRVGVDALDEEDRPVDVGGEHRGLVRPSSTSTLSVSQSSTGCTSVDVDDVRPLACPRRHGPPSAAWRRAPWRR